MYGFIYNVCERESGRGLFLGIVLTNEWFVAGNGLAFATAFFVPILFDHSRQIICAAERIERIERDTLALAGDQKTFRDEIELLFKSSLAVAAFPSYLRERERGLDSQNHKVEKLTLKYLSVLYIRYSYQTSTASVCLLCYKQPKDCSR